MFFNVLEFFNSMDILVLHVLCYRYTWYIERPLIFNFRDLTFLFLSFKTNILFLKYFWIILELFLKFEWSPCFRIFLNLWRRPKLYKTQRVFYFTLLLRETTARIWHWSTVYRTARMSENNTKQSSNRRSPTEETNSVSSKAVFTLKRNMYVFHK